MKIGLLGGSFNPIHQNHVRVARYVVEKGLVDEVWLMPCRKHAFDKANEHEQHRVNMINLAIEGVKGLKLCDIELKQEGTNYTRDTLRKLRQNYAHDFYLIIGTDILERISQWYGYEELAKEAKFIVFKRNSYSPENPGIKIEALLELGETEISSTEIRENIRLGKSIDDLVPEEVKIYIRREGLYK